MLDNFSRCEQCDGTGLRVLRNRFRWNAGPLVARVLSIRRERAMVSWGGLSMPSPQSRPAPLILTL